MAPCTWTGRYSALPGATYKGKPVGGLGHIGVFSLNRHKNIQCGEGGVAVTNDPELALRMQLIRNHAEAVVGSGIPGMTPKSLVNMMGFNFRMTEVEAAIALEQLKKLDALNGRRLELTEHLHRRLEGIEGLVPPKVREECTHIYYMDVYRFHEEQVGLPRKTVIDAIRAEGAPIWGGYLRPLYLEPLYQQKTAYKGGYPFANNAALTREVDYSRGICPVAERLYEKETVINIFNYLPIEKADVDHIADAIIKVFSHLDELRG